MVQMTGQEFFHDSLRKTTAPTAPPNPYESETDVGPQYFVPLPKFRLH